MSTIPTECPNCHAVLQAPPEYAGQLVTCSECGGQLQVPAAPAAPSAPAPAPTSANPLGIDTGADAHSPATPAGAPAFQRRRKKQQIDPKLIAIGAGVVVVLAGLWYFMSGGGVGAAMNYMPDGTAMIAVVHYDEMMDSKFTKAAMKEAAQFKSLDSSFKKEFGDLTKKIDTVTVGAASANGEAMAYVQFSSSVTSKEIRGELDNKAKFKSKTVGDRKVYVEKEGKGDDGFCLLDSKTVLIGNVELMKDIFERNGKPKLAKGMRAALEKADMSKTICMATSLKAKGASSAIPRGIPIAPAIQGTLKDADAVIIEADFGSSLDFKVTVVCDDSKDAQDLKKDVDDGIEKAEGYAQVMLGRAGEEFVESISISRSGSTVSLSGSVDVDLVKKFGDASKKEFPF